MGEETRWQRLVDLNRQLRRIELIELTQRQGALSAAEEARTHVLACVSEEGSVETGRLVAATRASLRTQRNLETAAAAVRDQGARVLEPTIAGRIAERRLAEATAAAERAREAAELAEVIDHAAGQAAGARNV